MKSPASHWLGEMSPSFTVISISAVVRLVSVFTWITVSDPEPVTRT